MNSTKLFSLFNPLFINQLHNRSIFTTPVAMEIRRMCRLRVVDNSTIGKAAMLEGKPPKCIHVYNKKQVGMVGDLVLVAIKGAKMKAILVGCHQNQKPMVPKFDSNNIVLIDSKGNPIGTRIHVPIPTLLRKLLKDKSITRRAERRADYTKLLALATRFV